MWDNGVMDSDMDLEDKSMKMVLIMKDHGKMISLMDSED